MITIIAAVAANRAIGLNNKLLYWLPNDLKRFKALTTGHTIIMGRRTFESLPKGALPNRRNVVLSRTQTEFPGCDTYRSLDEALAHCSKDEDIYIIGGASVYKQALNYADRPPLYSLPIYFLYEARSIETNITSFLHIAIKFIQISSFVSGSQNRSIRVIVCDNHVECHNILEHMLDSASNTFEIRVAENLFSFDNIESHWLLRCQCSQ